MKLLFENWRRYLTEEDAQRTKNIDKEVQIANSELWYSVSDEMQEYADAVSDGADPFETANKLFKPLGEGSTRRVYAIPGNNDVVLKVIHTGHPPHPLIQQLKTDPSSLNPQQRKAAKILTNRNANDRGFGPEAMRISNKNEVDIGEQLKNPDLFPRSIAYANDYSWIVIENVPPLNPQRFMDIVKFPHPPTNHRGLTQIVAKAVEMLPSLKEGFEDEPTVPRSMDPTSRLVPPSPPPPPDPLEGPTTGQPVDYAEVKRQQQEANAQQLLRNPQIKRILQFMNKHNIKLTELKPSNLGISNLSNKIVFIDVSRWENA
tara:strand:- start:10 stop:960 length:951 start_codon:yes stop_codon:yes gene_type:complete